MAELENQAQRITRRLAVHRQTLTHDLHQALSDTLFVNRPFIRPGDLKHIARAEVAALLGFLQQSDSTMVASRGAQLCREGLGSAYILRIGEVLRRFCHTHLDADLLLSSLEAVETYHSALMQGFIQAREAIILSEQERIRSALDRKLVQYAIENERLYQAECAHRQALARAHQQLLVRRERERRRLAQELHDGAVQQLLGISYQLADGKRLDAQRIEEMAPNLGVIQREVLGVVTLLRGLIAELRPAGLAELGLTAALEGYVARLEREGGPEIPEIELDLDKTGTALPEPAAICLFRAAQEALRNSLKHARAQHIKLTLHLLAGEAVLNVRDDGCGFRLPARLSELAQANHFGLVGTAERATWAGGQFTIRSQPGAGTEVTVRIPLHEEERDDDRDDPGAAGR